MHSWNEQSSLIDVSVGNQRARSKYIHFSLLQVTFLIKRHVLPSLLPPLGYIKADLKPKPRPSPDRKRKPGPAKVTFLHHLYETPVHREEPSIAYGTVHASR